MIKITKPEDCCGCTACVAVCSVRCIVMRADSEGFDYPVVDVAACIDCGRCDKVCPVLNRGERAVAEVYACRSKDEPVRLRSSSGGVFSLVAEKVIGRVGIVFGAAFDGELRLAHRAAETIEELEALRRSKYLQSSMDGVFGQVRHLLNAGREVMFSGVPCQIAGLKRYLGREYPGLVTVDIACHGVPSPKVFDYYLRSTFGDGVKDINFRDKRSGWNRYSVTVKYTADGAEREFSESFIKNPYMRGFLRRLYSRPVCHACPAEGLTSGSDLTLGDFWGIGEYHPEIDDNKGVSVVFVNTPRGAECFAKIAGEMVVTPATFGEGVAQNQSIVRSTSVSRKRAEFFATFEGNDFRERVYTLTRTPKYVKAWKRLRQIVRGLTGR